MVNGLVRDQNGTKKVLINIDSPKALNIIVGHETTHLLEGTKEYEELQEVIFNYAKEKGDFNGREKSLTELYNGIKADINSEITADLVGDYLFTDSKFIETLSTEKPTVFQKIKDLIDDLIIKFKGTKEEKNLREIQKKFKEAYKNTATGQAVNNSNGNAEFSMGKLTTGEDVVISDDINGSKPTKAQAKQRLEEMLGIKYINQSNNKEISIENKDIKKYLNDGYNNYKGAKLKKRIAGNYGEIIELAKINPAVSKPNYKESNRGKQGYDYYSINLAYPIKDTNGKIYDYKYYDARLVVRKDNNSNFAYDLDNFIQKKGTALDKTSLSIAAGKPASSSFSANNISQSNNNVNSDTSSTKYSMQESKIKRFLI